MKCIYWYTLLPLIFSVSNNQSPPSLSLRCLLLKLVEKSLGWKHPQLMLRRTESIVEKMLTNWLALCLYDYMKDYAGSSLFVLFKAIKFQVRTLRLIVPDPLGSVIIWSPRVRSEILNFGSGSFPF